MNRMCLDIESMGLVMILQNEGIKLRDIADKFEVNYYAMRRDMKRARRLGYRAWEVYR